jgi:hypothetical protein
MPAKTKKTEAKKTVVTLTHEEASRKNIPTAEYQAVMRQKEQSPLRVAYERRNRDLDPQLVWPRQRRAGLVRSGGTSAPALHTGEGTPEGAHRRFAPPHQNE